MVFNFAVRKNHLRNFKKILRPGYYTDQIHSPALGILMCIQGSETQQISPLSEKYCCCSNNIVLLNCPCGVGGAGILSVWTCPCCSTRQYRKMWEVWRRFGGLGKKSKSKEEPGKHHGKVTNRGAFRSVSWSSVSLTVGCHGDLGMVRS